MIIDGRALAKEILARTKARVAALPHPPRVLVIAANETTATKSYLAIKKARAADAGCILEIRHIKTSLRPLELFDMSKEVDAVIVQLPLPEEMDTRAILDNIPIEKDADVLSSAARTRFESMDIVSPYIVPPVVGAVQKILESENIEVKGKKAVVIGAGFLVGAPMATWLKLQGAEVEVVTLESGIGARATLAQADIIVSGAGSPHFIKPDMLKQGVVLIDAGASESNGALAGDADPACAEKCSLFTPVPGGVGPLAVACLFENIVTLAERIQQ